MFMYGEVVPEFDAERDFGRHANWCNVNQEWQELMGKLVEPVPESKDCWCDMEEVFDMIEQEKKVAAEKK